MAPRKKTTQEFHEQLKVIYGDTYDFSSSIYVAHDHRAAFICKVHGSVSCRTDRLLSGKGCPKCGTFKKTQASRVSAGDWATRLGVPVGVIAGDGWSATANLECETHGPYNILARLYEGGARCQKCSGLTRARKTKTFFHNLRTQRMHLAKSQHEYLYVNLALDEGKITLSCKDHGDFTITPDNHWKGGGCPKCCASAPEREMHAMLDSWGVAYETGDRKVLAGLELDLYFPDKNLAIEHHGLHWHSDAQNIHPNYHKQKRRMAKDKGVHVIQIFGDEWTYRRPAVESIIRHALGLSPTVGARKLDVEFHTPVPKEVQDFVERQHCSGYRRGQCCVVLRQQGQIISAMILSGATKGYTEKKPGVLDVARLASSHAVAGGLSKMVAAVWENRPDIHTLESYCDLRLFTGNGYKASGWEWVRRIEPTAWYTKGNERKHPRTFQKHKLVAQGYDPALTENQIMRGLGWSLIHDCGHDLYQIKAP